MKHIKNESNKTAIIIGAGPAGLTAAYELLRQKTGITPVVLESTDRIGGLAATLNYKGNRIDIGGHRFFSKSQKVMDWWLEQMPLESNPTVPQSQSNEDPDRIMLLRDRISRILYRRRFFSYPISLNVRNLLNLGFINTLRAGLGYVWVCIRKPREGKDLESFLVARFGRPLYQMFFEDYTTKVWGLHPRDISSSWGAQRIKGLSLSKAILNAFKRLLPRRKDDVAQKDVETSLIERFLYPKLGPGQLWEYVAADIVAMGGQILLGHEVRAFEMDGQRITGVITETEGQRHHFEADHCFSSMPVKHLIQALPRERTPAAIRDLAVGLPYRDFMTVGVLVKRFDPRRFGSEVFKDNWIYIQEPDVKVCRLQIFNNWSPYMVENPDHIWLGLEYMCQKSDDIWTMNDPEFIEFAVNELVTLGLVDRNDILDACRFKLEKAYPSYSGTYAQFDELKAFLNGIENLLCIGRNGQHRYNNQDHSMLTAIEAVRLVQRNSKDRSALWSINTEASYHEEKTPDSTSVPLNEKIKFA